MSLRHPLLRRPAQAAPVAAPTAQGRIQEEGMNVPVLFLLAGLLSPAPAATTSLPHDARGYHGAPRGGVEAPVAYRWQLFVPRKRGRWVSWQTTRYPSLDECEEHLTLGAYCEPILDST